MKTPEGFAGFDYDETVSTGEMPIEVVKGFKNLWKHNITTTFVTANRFTLLWNKLQRQTHVAKLENVVPQGTLISVSRGANIVNRNGRSLWSKAMQKAEVTGVLDAVEQMPIEYVAFSFLGQGKRPIEHLLMWSQEQAVQQQLQAKYGHYGEVVGGNLADLMHEYNPLMITVKPHDAKSVDYSGALPKGISFTRTRSGYYDINSAETDKLLGFQMLSEIMGIPPELGAGDDAADLCYVNSALLPNAIWVGDKYLECLNPNVITVTDPRSLGLKLQEYPQL